MFNRDIETEELRSENNNLKHENIVLENIILARDAEIEKLKIENIALRRVISEADKLSRKIDYNRRFDWGKPFAIDWDNEAESVWDSY